MKNSRLAVLERVAALCGTDLLSLDNLGQGWPALATVALPDGNRSVLLHVGRVGLSHRGRDHVERRMQNPGKGKPVLAVGRTLPLLIGLWEEDGAAALVGMDARRHLGYATRKSLFVPLRTLQQAAADGWAEHSSTSGESVLAFRPERLPDFVVRRARDWKLPIG